MPLNISADRVDVTDIARISREDADRLSKHLVESGDIVYSRRGDVTRKALITDGEVGMFCGTGCLLVRPGKCIDPKFLKYHLSSPRNVEWIKRHAVGATMPNLNTGILANIPLLVPSPHIQRAIAHILGTLDDKIELNRRMNETMEGMAQALFKSWFVDFDPVIDNALAAGNPIPAELTDRAEVRRAALADGTANREAAKPFPAAFQQTEELGAIPEGWEEVAVRDLCEKIQNGGTPRKGTEEFWDSGTIPWLTSGEVRQSLIIGTKNAITEAGLAGSSAKWIPAGSTVVAMYGATAGQVAFVSCKLTTNQAVCALIPKEHFTHFNYLSVDNKVRHFENQARGSAQQNINKGIIENSITVLPSIDTVKLFEQQTKPMFHKRQQAQIANETLAKLRDTLLPKLISGELRIADAEKLAEEALS